LYDGDDIPCLLQSKHKDNCIKLFKKKSLNNTFKTQFMVQFSLLTVKLRVVGSFKMTDLIL